jgi:DNA-binding NarL/FixJ family response regulator
LQGGKPVIEISCVIADDHALLRTGLVTLLEAETDICVNGIAADWAQLLGLLSPDTPDVAIIDLGLPGFNDLSTLREIAAPVIIYTGSDDLEALDLALEAGARGYVLKSGPPNELVRAIRMVNAGLPYVDPALATGLLEHRLEGRGTLLSAREAEVLQLLADGLTTEGVGKQLYLSPTTVRSYAENAMRKLEARNRVHAVAQAMRLGLLT